MVEQVNVEKALDYMRDNASQYARAKAERVYLEQFRKSQKALLVKEATGTIQEKDAYAYSHPAYLELLEALKEAVAIEQELYWYMKAAEIKVEVWRTQQANNRRIDGAHQ